MEHEEEVLVVDGQEYTVRHVRGSSDIELVSAPVEQATAAPGERRNVAPPRRWFARWRVVHR